VKDVMTKGAECISPDASIRDAALKMKALNIGPLPVCENNRLVGFITDRDIVVRAVCDGRDNSSTTVRAVMTAGIVCCFEDQDIEEAAQTMRDKQIRRLVVLDHDNRLAGILSLGDVAVQTRDEHLAGETLERISEPDHS
jgi:CBS domain-containing protein